MTETNVRIAVLETLVFHLLKKMDWEDRHKVLLSIQREADQLVSEPRPKAVVQLRPGAVESNPNYHIEVEARRLKEQALERALQLLDPLFRDDPNAPLA
ncbi:hypothetical protein AB3X91_08905 [Paraburkholderia sp. BR14263]|uniref:hypothetical protein n=1 Tax=unclassified Paraburkholderia TaxID=2615204 RepID=UPI0034CD7541